MLEKIRKYLLKKKILKQYYEDKAQEIMEEYLEEDKNCFAIRDKQGKIQEIRSFNYRQLKVQ